jgi:hypothetical protein
MKKIAMLGMALVSLLFLATAAWGLNTPEVIKDHGAITGRYVNDTGLIVGAEYGFTSKMAMTADIGEKSYNRVALKYELNPNLALAVGFSGYESSQLFFGINGAASMSKNLQGILQTDLAVQNDKLYCNYELGLKLNLAPKFDIRGGVMGTIDDIQTTSNLELGVGYRF